MVVIDIKEEIERRLSALVGLDVSAVSRAADMLTVHFGRQKQYTTRRGTVLEGGAWALHIQCNWKITRSGDVVATQDDLSGSDDEANRSAERLHELLVTAGPALVENVTANEACGAIISMSNALRIIISPGCVPGDEDWRFFEPGSDAKHFVIEGGKIDPWSLS